ncbi:MAG: aspartate aminotransferase family protein [Alphaproteobacteria bacterium]|nr:MAG: aspartate aminotransferase family protein [Alphaproteobacteria bacterium]
MTNVLDRAAAHAAAFLDSLSSRPIATTTPIAELQSRLGGPLPEAGMPAEAVIDALVRDTEGGLIGSGSGRFFGWVIGGTLPVALAADWLTSAWDQNAASNLTAPAEAVVEQVCGEWAKEMFGLPASASFAFVTGCQMAHTTALAAARHKLMRDRGWDVEAKGLAGAPPLRILTTENRHESILRSARLLGVGTDAIVYVQADNSGRIEMRALEQALSRTDGPTVVCLQAGDLNTGVFDPFEPACRLAHAAKAWVHVDGAFGLWAAASERHRHLLAGAERADSWATDGHKWLNLPFDSGLVFVADAAAHRASFAQDTSYSVPTEQVRNQKDWNPEWSRRGRGFPFYAAVRALGRSGICEMVDRCCGHAERLVREIGGLDGAEIVAAPVINQGLVRFLGRDGDHDAFTDGVIRRIQQDGVAWFGGVTWGGMRVMRVSVCNWLTSDDDIDRTVESVRKVLMLMRRS